jgi:hypothetical protein
MTLENVRSLFRQETLLEALEGFSDNLSGDYYTAKIENVTGKVFIASTDTIRVHCYTENRELTGTFQNVDSAVLFLEGSLLELFVGPTDGLGTEPVTENCEA